jgi:hypothetical protein
MRSLSRIHGALAAACLIATAGCSAGLGNLGGLGDILGGGTSGSQQGQVTAEVQQVDTRQQRVYVRTQSGQSEAVMYDRNTQVVYQQQQYPVTALEQGDVVTMQLQQDPQGNLYAGRIDVEQSVQERTGQGSVGSNGFEQLAGRVGQVNYQQGLFQLQSQYGGTVTVSLPYNAPQATVQYFQRLRTGDSVRLEGTPLGSGRVELYRFL